MTAAERNSLRTIVIALVTALLAWGAKRYDASKLDTSRFVQDSTQKAEQSRVRDSLLVRIDQRVTAMYCGSVPIQRQPGCR